MATYFLDPDDEITKAAALIRDDADSEVALVVPPGSRVATSRMNFRLLAREAAARQRRLSIVAPDSGSRALAASAGLPVFASVADHEAAVAGGGLKAGNGRGAETAAALEELAATVPTAEPPRGLHQVEPAVRRGSSAPKRADLPAEHRGISASSALLAILLLAIVVAAGAGAYLLVPSANIALTPRAEAMSPLQLSVKVDPSVRQPDAVNLVAPGMSQPFPVQATGNYRATGEQVNQTNASGIVTFTNSNTGGVIKVPAGTQVWTNSGIVFLTQSTITVPQAATSPFAVATQSVAVQAQRAGPAGNVGANTIVNMPASIAAQAGLASVSVSNANATSGGSRTVTKIVQQSDIDAATQDLQSQLTQQFNGAITDPSKIPSGMRLFADTAQLGTASFDPDPATLLNKPVDQANPTFALVATASGTATAADLSTVRSIADQRLRQNVPHGRELVEDSISIEFGDATATGTLVNVAVVASAKTLPTLDLVALKNEVKGKSQAEARRILSQFGDVDLHMSPDWMPNLPGFDFRIDLKLVEPSPSPSASPSPTQSHTAPPASATPSGPAVSQAPST